MISVDDLQIPKDCEVQLTYSWNNSYKFGVVIPFEELNDFNDDDIVSVVKQFNTNVIGEHVLVVRTCKFSVSGIGLRRSFIITMNEDNKDFFNETPVLHLTSMKFLLKALRQYACPAVPVQRNIEWSRASVDHLLNVMTNRSVPSDLDSSSPIGENELTGKKGDLDEPGNHMPKGENLLDMKIPCEPLSVSVASTEPSLKDVDFRNGSGHISVDASATPQPKYQLHNDENLLKMSIPFSPSTGQQDHILSENTYVSVESSDIDDASVIEDKTVEVVLGRETLLVLESQVEDLVINFVHTLFKGVLASISLKDAIFLADTNNQKASFGGFHCLNPQYAVTLARWTGWSFGEICYQYHSHYSNNTSFSVDLEIISRFHEFDNARKIAILKLNGLNHPIHPDIAKLICRYCELKGVHRSILRPIFYTVIMRDELLRTTVCKGCHKDRRICSLDRKDHFGLIQDCTYCERPWHVSAACNDPNCWESSFSSAIQEAQLIIACNIALSTDAAANLLIEFPKAIKAFQAKVAAFP